jgi:3-oxoacyl-[acyl-carrier protein] reductase
MDLGIAGRKAIVCGSSRGLGRACAQALLREGVEVVLNGRDEGALQALAVELTQQTGTKAAGVAADLNTQEGRDRLLAACPNPDILVNNNGGPPFKDFRELDRTAMEKGVAMNMLTPIELIQRVIEGMAERGFGRIVNITSVSVKMPISGLDLSSGARAGLTAFLAGVARDYARRGVTINQLLPGYFLTERLQEAFDAQAAKTGAASADVAQSWTDQVPASRLGDPVEFGKTCAYLCGTHAGYITGQNILMDGGLFRSAF